MAAYDRITCIYIFINAARQPALRCLIVCIKPVFKVLSLNCFTIPVNSLTRLSFFSDTYLESAGRHPDGPGGDN